MITLPRAERHAQILALRAAGLNHREIALELGITRSTVANIFADPDGSKQAERRKRYQGVCIDCEGPTDGSGGYNGQRSMRCKWCASGRERPRATLPRLRVPIRLTEIPLDVRLEGVRYASYRERDASQRLAILVAAMSPSDRVYWVSESARSLIDSWHQSEAA
jgi:hypothetical protein